MRNLLVVGQVAVSLVLLIAAGLFLRSVRNAYSIDPGFETENIAILTMNLEMLGYSEEKGMRFHRQALERVEALLGVSSVALADRVPLGYSVSIRGFVIEGYELPPGEDGTAIDIVAVGPKYFETMGIPLMAGRGIRESDTAGSPKVVIINETMARRFWSGQNPIGKRIRHGNAGGDWYEVVGVCSDYKVRTMGEDNRPYVHYAYLQESSEFQNLLVRTAGDPGLMLDTIRRELRLIEPDLVFFDVRTMQDNLSLMLFPVRVGAGLLSIFGFLALGMASVGLYGVIAYSVSRRTHEFGLRLALGAQTADVLKLVVKQGMILVGLGILFGLIGAMAVTWVLSSVLYGISAIDPLTFGATSFVLAVVALLANYIPARRAASIDPMDALRYE